MKLRESMLKFHRGFSLIEVMVVMAIISVLAGILLPAVRSTRNTARRLECQNRLRQFGVALHSFESAHGAFPDPFIPVEGEPLGRYGRPIQIKLLPHLDQEAAYQKITSTLGITVNSAEFKYRFAVFQCPGDISTTGLNYRVCVGANSFEGSRRDSASETGQGYGVFGTSRGFAQIRAADITDGLSNTAAMSERSRSHGPGSPYDPTRDIWFSGVMNLGFDPYTRSADDALNACVAGNAFIGRFYSNRVGLNYVEYGLHDTSYNHVATPNGSIPDCTLEALQPPSPDPRTHSPVSISYASVSARSFHPGDVVNVLSMDGSVRSVASQVDTEVWRGFATRADADKTLSAP